MVTASSPPSVLYHYTTATGLIGILNTRKIWATHASFLNDASELEYAFDLIERILASYPSSEVLSRIRKRFVKPLPAFFMACFCEIDDLLSQWRAYVGKSTGYSVGFDTRYLPTDHMAQVLYDPVVQETEVRAVIDESFENSNYTEEYRGLALEAALLRLSARLKHPTFEAEREWRLVFYLEDEHSGVDFTSFRASFRPGDQFVIPYTEVDLPTKNGLWDNQVLHLASIRFGPSANPKEASYSLRWLLWKYGYSETETTVGGSQVPLRR